MQIQEYLTYVRNCQNHTIHIAKHMHADVFCSYQNRGNAIQDELSCFNFFPWYVHVVPMLSTFSLLMSKETARRKWVLVVPSFPSLLCLQFSISDQLTHNSGKRVSWGSLVPHAPWNVTALHYSGVDKTHLPGSCRACTHCVSTRILCWWSIADEWG